MEDPRISRMYAAMMGEKLKSLRFRIWRAAVMRSGMLTTMVLAILVVGLVVALKERGRGHLHKLATELKPKPATDPVIPIQPGGQDPIVLQRSQIAGGVVPEFLSATLLPGRGMNVLQITAFIPDKGEVPLLVSPPLHRATEALSGAGEDAEGAASLAMGGAFEVPWASRIQGVPTPGGEGVLAVWQGKTMLLPSATGGGKTGAVGGLLLKRRADEMETNVMPDGGQAQAVYDSKDFDGHWLSQTVVTTSILLSSRALEIKLVARNTGTEPEPLGIGWVPRFAIVSGDRANVTLRLPSALRTERRADGSGLPTGRLVPVTGTEYDFTERGGARLGTKGLDESFVHLQPALLDNGPAVELRDTAAKFGLRITALTSTIKSFSVYAPANESMVSIDPQFNYVDPFGHEWPKGEDTGLVELRPGQSVQWKVRLEIFPLNKQVSGHF